ncbi:MAG: hypothetical protein FJY86_00450 [Candidatus Diapherotrites archaeon]|uniref:Uncharacterized protein n=1 Tax=Candidatus Iainarchaeum sp. TaxID=3101447 RepID=A0A8T4C667_9ARCH|nr:hypothetical protein [Candidatus Diapherotrites archaeon]
MVNEEMVLNTIQKMRDAGLSDAIISSTLADLGLTPNQVQGFLSGRGSGSSSAQPVPASRGMSSMNNPRALEHEELATRTSEKILSQLDERDALDSDVDELKDNITRIALEQHGEQLKDTHNAVMELHDKFDSTAMDTLNNRVMNMNARMEQLSRDVVEIKSMSLALQSLLQKILEANQQLLFEMKSKK